MATQTYLACEWTHEKAFGEVTHIADRLQGHACRLVVHEDGKPSGVVVLSAMCARDMRRWAITVNECAAKAEAAEAAEALAALDAKPPEDLSADELTGEARGMGHRPGAGGNPDDRQVCVPEDDPARRWTDQELGSAAAAEAEAGKGAAFVAPMERHNASIDRPEGEPQ